MKKDNQQPIKEAIELFVRQYGLENKLRSVKIEESWHQIVGDYVSKKTLNTREQAGVLFVSIESSELKNELLYAKSKIISSINEKIQENYLLDVRFI
ncbi:MAG: hypothetical protein C4K58_03015 [Flavobacteriaceae bacterium]|nr:MAG: hypothetical protein C4K58_03015 [Flavobacteriaceae bacterium]